MVKFYNQLGRSLIPSKKLNQKENSEDFIDLSYKRLKRLPDETNSFASTLTKLDLAFNKIRHLDSNLTNFKNLEWLRLTGNWLTDLPACISNMRITHLYFDWPLYIE